jgi:hypothetical protein
MRIIFKAKPIDGEDVLLSNYVDTYPIIIQHKLEYLGEEYGVIFMLPPKDLDSFKSFERRRVPIKTLIFKLSGIPKFLDKECFYGSIEKYFDRINARGYIEVDLRSFGEKSIAKDLAMADIPYWEISSMDSVKKIIDVMNEEE